MSLVGSTFIRDTFFAGSTSHDTEIDNSITPLSEVIKGECGRDLIAVYFDYDFVAPFPLEKIVLKTYPISTVVGFTFSVAGEAMVVDDDYHLDAEKGIVEILGFPISVGATIHLAYKGGYEAIPGDLKYAAGKLIAYSIITGKFLGEKSEKLGDRRVVVEEEWPQDVIRILNRYKDIH